MNALKSGIVVGSVAAIALTFALGLRLGHASAQAEPSLADGPVIDLTRHRGVVVEGEVGTRGRLSVACPSGTVIGGGFSHVGKDIQVIESRPDGIYAWQVSWVQLAADDSVLYVYASCLVS
jgi:hypothetical protein